MTAPVEHLFRDGVRAQPGDVPLQVLEALRERAVKEPTMSASVMDGSRGACRIYSLALRPGDASPMPSAFAPDIESA